MRCTSFKNRLTKDIIQARSKDNQKVDWQWDARNSTPKMRTHKGSTMTSFQSC